MTHQSGTDRPEGILVQNRTYPIHELSEYGFKTRDALLANTDRTPAVLQFGQADIDVVIRERDREETETTYSFVRLPLSDQQTIRRYLSKKSRVGASDSLDERTYDELAAGAANSGAAKSTATKEAPETTDFAKAMAMLAMLAAMAILALLALAFLRSRGSLTVANSALSGNFLPINAKVPGEIVDVQVQEGDFVRKGDVLVRLANPEMEVAIQTFSAQMQTAEARVKALTRQMDSFQSKLAVAKKKLQLDLEVARSQRTAAEKSRQVAASIVERYRPYVESGAVTQLEFDAARNELLVAESEFSAAENQMRQIEFSRDSTTDKILILGDRFDDAANRVETDLEIARAELSELRQMRELTSQQIRQLEIVAPRDGQVYAMYHQAGEYLKIADQIVALSHPGDVWATGQVTAAQASRVRPGQPVKVNFPSLDKEMEGVVTAVGHRAIYSKGNYSSEFRGTVATDVPIKVAISDLPSDVPAGIRLNLAISTGYGLKWLDDLTGFKLKPIGSKADAIEIEPEVSQVAAE